MVKKTKSEEFYVKLGGVIACTGLLCVHREITQRPLSTEPKLICPYVCFAIHVIRGMHSCVVCVCMSASACVCVRAFLGQAENSLDVGGNSWLLAERLRVPFTTLSVS